MKEVGFLGRAVLPGNALETVPQNAVAGTAHVDWIVRFEQTAIRAEGLNDPANGVSPHRREILGFGGFFLLVPTNTHHGHADTSELQEGIGAAGEFGHHCIPVAQGLITAVAIGANAQKTAKVIDDDRSLRAGFGDG